jgi:hypothetical protein
VPVDALVIEVSIFDNSDASFRMRQGEIKKWHFFCESGNPEYPRHCNKASAASEARQRRSRRGNPEYSRHCETAQPTRQSRQKTLDCFTSFAMTAMHHCLAGLLHFVRNDGILDSITTSKYPCHCVTAYLCHCETAQPARQSRIPSSLRDGAAGVAIQNTLVIATRLQLRAKRGRGVADAAIQNTKPLDCFTSFAMTARVS